MARLTAKQKRFVDEYLIDLNATQAVIRAGYKVSGSKSANEIGSQLLRSEQVAVAVARAQAERSKRTGITQDRVVMELAKIALVNAADVVDFDTVTVKESATREDLACIQSVKARSFGAFGEKGVEREIKLADKLKALELLGRHLGMFTDRIEVSGMAEEMSKLDDLIGQLRGTETVLK